jgi:hypothetical protein
MAYKTNWLGGILAPMLLMAPTAQAIQTNMTGSGAHSVFIDNGSVFAMGSNQYGEIMPGSSGEFRTPLFMGIQDVKTVAASQLRMAVLKNDGTAVVNGISFTTWANMSNPFPMTGLSDIALTLQEVYFVKDGNLFQWTGDANSAPVAVVGGTGVKSVAAGNYHVVILFNDGTVGTFGKNASGQLGSGDLLDVTAVLKLPLVGVEEIAASANNSYAKLNGRSVVYGWGSNSGNQLGFADAVNRLVPTQLATPANVYKMVGGQSYMALMTGDGSVYSAGWHDWIGSGLYNVNTSFVKIPMPQVDDIGGGNDQVIVKLTGTVGKVSGWGGNVFGKLGDGVNTERHSLTDAYFTPVTPPAPPVVATPPTPPASEPVVPPSEGGAIMNPLQPQTPPVDMGTDETSIAQAILDAAADAAKAIADAAKALADAAAAALQAAIDAAKALADAAAALVNSTHDKDHDNNKDGAKHDGTLGHENSSAKSDDHDDDHKVEVKKEDKKEASKKDDDKKEVAKKDDDKKDGKKKS